MTQEVLKVTIDGRPLEVEEGATILDAAQRVGIEIPTLCYLEGLAPVSSCFLCAVQVEGRPNLSPACSMPVADGMVVTTDSEDIRAARKMALELMLSDHVGDCVAPCSLACPATLDIPGFLRQIVLGQHRRALESIKDRIALPGALGRVCPGFCERACRRGDVDEPVAICILKRFPADCAGAQQYVPARAEPTGKKVAIVGAGPAGLSAAYYLLQQGHACTIFDARPRPGGLFRYGIPEFRLPNGSLDAEIAAIEQLGAEFRMNTRLGAEVGLEQLRTDFDAVLLAFGAGAPQTLSCEGADLALPALEFLESVATGQPSQVGNAAVVIGSDDLALDAARTAMRLGAGKTTVLYTAARERVPAVQRDRMSAAEAEAVEFVFGAEATRLEAAEGGKLKLTCQEESLEADCVIDATGREVDAELAESQGLTMKGKGVAVDRRTLATNLPGVFAGGDVASGPSHGVRAVAAGKLAALSIQQFLAGEPVVGEPRMKNVRMGKLAEEEREALFAGVARAPRVTVLTIDSARRRSFDEVETGLPEADAVAEAARCLQCDCGKKDDCKLRIYAAEYDAELRGFEGERRTFERETSHPDIVYESGKCIQCSLCVRIAEEARERLGLTFIGRGFSVKTSVPFSESLAEGLRETARRCAEACPTGALSLRD